MLLEDDDDSAYVHRERSPISPAAWSVFALLWLTYD